MDFDFTTETITPDLGSILIIGGSGALELPSGATLSGALPSGVAAGAVRWNSTLTQVEYNNGGAWVNFGGSVSSVTLATTGTGLTVSGGSTQTITTSGTFIIAGTLGAGYGGTGTATPPTAGQVLVGVTGGTYIPYTLASGSGISTTAGSGTLQINNTGVLSITGTTNNITVSPTTGNAIVNLAAVTQGAGSNFVKVTLDGFGRVTGNTAVSQGDITTALGSYYLPLAGGTMSGAINMGTSQINNLGMAVTPVGTDAVNVNYVQAAITGLSWKQAVIAATTGPFTSNYANGISGVGATLTATTNVVLPLIDTISLAATNRVLVKNQGNTFENGIYTVTSLGSAGVSPWVLTRATDSDTAAEVDGSAVYVDQGGTQADTGWTETSTMTAIGAGNPIIWAQFSGSGAYTAGTGISIVANTINNTGVTSVGMSVPSFLSVSPATVTTTGTFAVTLTSETANTIFAAPNGSAGTPTFRAMVNADLPLTGVGANTYGQVAFNTAGVITGGAVITDIAHGGTNFATYAVGDMLYADTTASLAKLSDIATGNVLLSGGTNTAPSWGKVGLTTAVTGILPIANGGTNSGTALSGSTIMVSNGTQVVQGGAGTTTTVLHGNAGGAPTYSAVSLTADVTGILPAANGGTGLNGSAAGNGTLLIGNGTGYSLATLAISGTSLYVANGAGTITLSGPKFYSEFSTAPINAPTATASQAIALGTGASASTYGVLATANGEFSAAGDSQSMSAILRLSTNTAAASQALYLDATGTMPTTATLLLTVPTTSVWTYTIKVAARNVTTAGNYGSWIFNGVIHREAAGAPAIPVGGVSKTTLARVGLAANGTNDPVVSAGATDLHIAVTPPNTDTWHWVASVDLVQVI
jgi:hypothetical protein